ncbi:MAG TPA: phenylalanine--tRNA ligase beta subunit-related protein [bacterium]|nr:phenylalanine--tRNA ligase beta subunit-related protein [bacterium]
MVALDEQLRDRVALGILRAARVQVQADAPALEAALAALAARYRARYAGRSPGEIAELQPARELYRRTGEDPTKLRPSSEALLRRVLRGEPLPRINALVDTCNLCSLEFLLPIGLYDADRIVGAVTVRLGRPGEGYASLGKGHYTVAGRLALFDAEGPFGSPTNDSRRTAITPQTTRSLMVIFAPARYPGERLARHVAAAAEHLRAFVAAEGIETALLGGDGRGG